MFSGSDIEEKIPTLFHGGIAFKLNLPEHDSDVNISIEGGQYQNGYQYTSFGIEHIGAKTLALRLGYRYVVDEEYLGQLDSLSQWRAGLGLKIKTVVIDYAYQPYAKLGDVHRVSFTKKFVGWKTTVRQLPITLKVDPIIFSPNSDGAKDVVFFFPKHKTIKKIKSCQLTIRDSMGVAVQKLTEEKLPNILSWDGRDILGETVLEGEYSAEFVLQGEGKVAKSREKSLKIDLTPPAINLEASAETISPDGDGIDDTLTFNLTASDTYLIDRWKLDILNQKNNIIKSYKSISAVNRNSVIKTILWDGKDELYGKVVPNDMYNVKLSVWDVAGNEKSMESFVNVYVPPKVIEKIIEKVKEVKIKEEARGLVVSLSSEILFNVGKFTLKRASAKALNEVVEILRAYPENKVKIEGHTDSTGSYERNVALSSKRAWNVYSYLVRKGGIGSKRLSAKGYGPDKPVALNTTAAGRAKNRRVEIIILKK
jgi:outer membrane protein OmpA-like peptidoglycan-associated protein